MLTPATSAVHAKLITDLTNGDGQNNSGGNRSNNDFIDLLAYYNQADLDWSNTHHGGGKDYGNPLEWLRAGQARQPVGTIGSDRAGRRLTIRHIQTESRWLPVANYEYSRSAWQ